jgi:hypothetical protein
MNCPSCNHPATSFLRNAFSLQGVSFSRSVKGYFKCQHCGSLLRITSYGKPFWYFFSGAIVVLILFALLYRRLIFTIGMSITASIWILIVLVITFIFTFGIWKYGRVEKVDEDPGKKDQQQV